MKKKKLLVVIICVLLIIIGVVFILYKKGNKEELVDNSLQNASILYFDDTKSTVTSVMALIENGYLEASVENKCDILEFKDNNVKFVENNCTLATEIAKNPVILVNGDNNYIIDAWNKAGTTLSFKLKNDGNSYYKTEDIKAVSWIGLSGNVTNDFSIEIDSKNTYDKYQLLVEFEDLVLTYDFDILIDVDKPILINKDLENGINVEYEDNFLEDIYYYVSKENKAPKASEMATNNNFKFECNTPYYAWSYATDKAGNQSNIDFLGTYTQVCQEVHVSGSKE